MNALLLACHFLPLIGLLLVLILGSSESRIAAISFLVTHVMGAAIIGLLSVWALGGFAAHEYEWFTLYKHEDYHFPIVFYLDKIGAAYLFCIWVIFSVIVRYCRYYLHREAGYKRFFLTIFAFAFGLNTVVLSGSIDQLFAGWEVVGISSFLLIAFYRHRVQPVRNALRAYTIYRFCDIGLLLGAWMIHLLFHNTDHFSQLSGLFQNNLIPPANNPALMLLSLFILIAASGKSAQFPFCFWLPRAMEGPTPSSAIFYGALSVHLGVFLLLRTAPIWSFQFITRLMVFVVGLLSVATASIAEKTQSNIKGQIAYSSITQVGFMFMELALGLESLVVVHFMGNAFLRCYQLLVSPSIVAHLLRVEGSVDSDFQVQSKPMHSIFPFANRENLPEVLQNTLYVFALQEGNLELWVRMLLWEPLKRWGAAINAKHLSHRFLAFIAVFIAAWSAAAFGQIALGLMVFPAALGMVLASLSAFSQKRSVFKTWNAIGLSCIFAGFSVLFLRQDVTFDVMIFMSGIVPSWLLGLAILGKLLKGENFTDEPFLYRAKAETKPFLSSLLFLSFLGLVGFPITPAFLGEDLLLYHASSGHAWVAALIAIAFVINGIAAAAVFLRLCMGSPVEVSSDSDEYGKNAVVSDGSR